MTFEQVVGAALEVLFLADIFLTVLYARAGTGLLGRRGAVLSLGGPLIVISLIGFWSLGLTVGAALVIHPELGTAIRPSSGEASTDFVTALLVAGNSLSIVGGGDYSPHTTGTRLLYLLHSLIGSSVLSLVLSYLVQVYSALRERNALALTVHLMTGSTGEAAQMLARLAPDGDCSNASSELGNLARSLAATKEAHHFYPLLFYFRFEEPLYAVSRFSFVLLDLVTLIETALDQTHCASLVRSGPVTSLRDGTLLLLDMLSQSFPVASSPNDTSETSHLRRSYAAATDTLARAGVPTQGDGIESYVADRRTWEPRVERVAPALGYTMDEIDRRSSR